MQALGMGDARMSRRVVPPRNLRWQPAGGRRAAGNGDEITLGAIGSIECAATAADGHNVLAMLVSREGETLSGSEAEGYARIHIGKKWGLQHETA